ncbi:MAG TPA: hypothetical protein VJP58_11315 [Candidatus Nitrosocosmicus sp.]|nr:hypothetical protein [Candidatus Nitrosocosmicus sp.]
MKYKFICQDSYEAEKLTSIFAPQKDNSLFVSNIVKTVGTEVVVKLKDGSHHSILFKDETNSYKLELFFKELLLQNAYVTDTKYVGDMALISLSEPLSQ